MSFINKYNFLLLFIVLYGIFLRFYHLTDTQPFALDESRDAYVVRAMFTQHEFPLIGPTTSIGEIRLGPFFYYLMAPWLWWFDFDPIGMSVGTAVLGSLTLILIFIIAKQIAGKEIAFWGTVLYAVLPIYVDTTRRYWNPYPLPLFALLLYWSLWKVWREKKRIKKMLHIVLAWMWFGIALQLHYSVAVVLPFMLLVMIITIRKSQQKKWLFVASGFGLMSFILLLSSLIWHEYTHGYEDFYKLLQLNKDSVSHLSSLPLHYVGFLFPLFALGLGVFAHWLYKENKVVAIAGFVCLLLFCWSRYNFNQPLVWQIKDYRNVAEKIIVDKENQHFNVLKLESDGEFLGLSYRYFLEDIPELADPGNVVDIKNLYIITDHESDIAQIEQAIDQLGFVRMPGTIGKQWIFKDTVYLYRLSY